MTYEYVNKRITVGEILRRAANIAINRGEGGGGWHIHEAAIWTGMQREGQRALSLYHQLYDQSTIEADQYFWFDNVEQVALALLFAAEVADEEITEQIPVPELEAA